MQIQLNEANESQLAGLRENFESDMVVHTVLDEDCVPTGKYNVTLNIETEIDAWKLFFSGADYCLAKMGRVKL